jgi:NIPSNAP protein
MITQIRIYTINRGAMDDFLKHFHDETMPLHEKVGIPIIATFVHRPQNEFIWVRTYADEADRDAKTKAFQDAAREAGVVLGGHVAKMEIREAEPAFVPAAAGTRS